MTKKFDENMEEFFEIESSREMHPIAPIASDMVFHENLENDFMDDYRTARANLDDLINQGKDAFSTIIAIAKESEKGRDFEVAAILLRDIVNANEKLVSLHKTVRDIANYKNSSSEKTTINNTLFVGSTADLSRMLKDIKDQEIIDIEDPLDD